MRDTIPELQHNSRTETSVCCTSLKIFVLTSIKLYIPVGSICEDKHFYPSLSQLCFHIQFEAKTPLVGDHGFMVVYRLQPRSDKIKEFVKFEQWVIPWLAIGDLLCTVTNMQIPRDLLKAYTTYDLGDGLDQQVMLLRPVHVNPR